MKALETLALAALCVAALDACTMLEELEKSGEAARRAASAVAAGNKAPQTDDEKDAALADKLDAYIGCVNDARQRVVDAERDYLRHVDAVKGPTGKETTVDVPELGMDACLSRLADAKKKAPPLPELEPATAAFESALSTLVKLTKQAHAYYDLEEYKDDGFAKGIAMHRPLMAAFAAVDKAEPPFAAAVWGVNDALCERRLARFSRDPARVLPYDIAKSLEAAKKLARLGDVRSLQQVNLAALTAAVTAYEQSLALIASYADAHPDESSKVLPLPIFQYAAGEFLSAAKALVRRKRENKDFKGDDEWRPELVAGNPANVRARYDELVYRTNGLRYR